MQEMKIDVGYKINVGKKDKCKNMKVNVRNEEKFRKLR